MVKRMLALAIIICSLTLISGCTLEKAKALKLAASQFNIETQKALDQLETILIQNMAMPPVNVEKITADLSDLQSFNINIFEQFKFDLNPGLQNEKRIKASLAEVKMQYHLFASIFRSLDKSHLLAGDSVKKAEKTCMKLSLKAD